ncbi:cation transporter [Amphritea sp. 2_MG-2023]|uniref:cation transporter n=1 Tax=Amphritea TaxID=515417 RepID=UPI001C078759|nr:MULTISPECIES: cation transporter [Amphritea]MBU2964231.1 cation transporter [Amphritea atlantica]MDO6419512.1 cation transporter [Amphritea sp. 2_MG-2023]MDX2423512.1 cation transporter [Amphritea sp.]
MAGCNSCACDNTTDTERNNPLFRRILWIALLSNAVMFFVEIVGSIASGSISLQADALDFFGDAVNYGITLFVIAMALHVRAKAALFKSATMAAFGLWVIGSAIYRAYTGSTPDPIVMGTIGMSALVVNAVVALLLFRYRSGDSNMRSIWLCSRNDALSNIAVMMAAGGVLATDTGWPDLAVAALIAALSLSAALEVMKHALTELRTEQQ